MSGHWPAPWQSAWRRRPSCSPSATGLQNYLSLGKSSWKCTKDVRLSAESPWALSEPSQKSCFAQTNEFGHCIFSEISDATAGCESNYADTYCGPVSNRHQCWKGREAELDNNYIFRTIPVIPNQNFILHPACIAVLLNIWGLNIYVFFLFI